MLLSTSINQAYIFSVTLGYIKGNFYQQRRLSQNPDYINISFVLHRHCVKIYLRARKIYNYSNLLYVSVFFGA